MLVYLVENITVSGNYDGSGQNPQIANPIQNGVRGIKRTDGKSYPLVDTIRSLEIAVFLTLDGLGKRVFESVIPDEFAAVI